MDVKNRQDAAIEVEVHDKDGWGPGGPGVGQAAQRRILSQRRVPGASNSFVGKRRHVRGTVVLAWKQDL